MKRKIWLLGVVAIAFTGLGIYASLDPSQPPSQASSIAALLTQSLPDINGQPQNLGQWKKRKLIVNFWATWCAPCVQEMPELSALQSEITSKNIQIIGVGIDNAANITQFSTKHQINYPLYVAGPEAVTLLSQFGNPAGGLPFTLLIGEDGQIKRTYLGRLRLEQLRRDLQGL